LPEVDGALRKYRSSSPEWEWRFRTLKARILVSSSRSEDALAVLDPEPPDSLARTEIPEQRKLYQGIAHRSAQQFADAERDFAIAKKYAEQLDPFYKSQLLIAEADLLVDERKYSPAEASYRTALFLARRQSLPRLEANALADWARLATYEGRYDEALDRNLEAIQLAKAMDMKGNIATSLGNLGWDYLELGDFEASLDYFTRSAQAAEKSGLKGYSAYWFSGAAGSYLALHDYSSAEGLALKTLASAKELNDAETIAVCLNTLAGIMLRTNRLAEAEHYNQEALNFEQTGKDKLHALDSFNVAGEIATGQGHFPEAAEMFERVIADPEAEPRLLWQAQAGLAQVREGQGRPAQAESEYIKAIQTFETARNSINHDELRLSFLSSGIAVYGNYIDFLIHHERPLVALNEAELSRSRTLAEGLSSDAQAAPPGSEHRVQPQQLARRLHSTLLFYWLGEDHSYLWIVTPEKTACVPLPPAREIDPLVKSYREALLDSRDPLEMANADGQRLYELLVQPASKLIPPGSRVILLPDGSLYGVNFETLIVPGPKPHYWIDDVTLTTANSLTLLASAASRPAPKEKSLFLVGDTVSPNPDFPVLPQAAAEMHDVEKYFPAQRREVLSGSEATPAAYLNSDPQHFAYLHFVTHGTASRARPLESAVVLSKDKDEDSYKLYARDIVKRHLSAYLVTISACNGAGTRAYSGEGLVGLSWAFLRAGAHNVIGALWEVSDTSTPDLMDKLYDGLSHGEDPATALRAAKLSLLHSDSVFRKPYYWAPFQLYAGS
jgi:CHAT domain-containing protein